MTAVGTTAQVPPLDSAEARAARAAAEAEQAWWAAHYAAYLAQYPEQFVAVRDNKVVAAHADLQHLLAALGRQHIAPADVWVRFVTADPHRITP
jgi:hypothetical protein